MNFRELGANLGLEEDEYVELIELFVTTGSAELQRLQTAVATTDLAQIACSAHTIKGSAGNLGLMEIYQKANTIEAIASGGQPGSLPDVVHRLAEQIRTVAKSLKAA